MTLWCCFNGHFPEQPGHPVPTRMTPFWVLLKLRMMEVVVTTGAIKHAQLQSYHHQQTNTQLFTGWLSFLSPNQQRQSTYWSVRIEVGKQKQQICRSQCCLCTFVACRMVRRWLIHHIQENIQSASIWMKRWPLLCQSVCLSVCVCLPACQLLILAQDMLRWLKWNVYQASWCFL